MNLLDHFIKEVHSVEPHNVEGVIMDFVKVDMTTICYGVVEKGMHIFEVNEWEKIKKDGKYLG